MCGSGGWLVSLGSAHTWSATSPNDHPHKHTHRHTHAPGPHPMRNKYFDRDERTSWRLSLSVSTRLLPVAGWVGTGPEQDGLSVSKQDLRKPQPLLESITPPPHPPVPRAHPNDCGGKRLTLSHLTMGGGGQQILWVSKLWQRGKK